MAAADADGDTISYALTAGNDDGLFAIDNNGTITLASGSLDFESATEHDLTVTATSTGSSGTAQTDTLTLKITVTDVNDAPTLANAIADQVATEGQGFSYTIQANTFADEDAGDIDHHSC